MDNVIDVLRDKGHKITPQRRAVINALLNCGPFSTALQLLEYVKKEQPDVSLDTVYRNLSLFQQLGIVNEIQMINQDGNRFEISRDGHHHHIICLKCGKIECLQKCPVSKEAIETIEKNGFAVVSHSLEFYGYCCGCQK